MMEDNDNELPPVTIITGRVVRRSGDSPITMHLMLIAPDDDTAVRRALDALREKGYTSAELDQIGQLDDAPDDEPFASAYQGALEGEVSLVTMKEDRR